MIDSKVGFIGLGAMGKSMALNVAKAKVDLSVFDLAAEPVAALVEAGASAVSSPAELGANVDVALLCLPYTPQVEATLFGDEGLLSKAKPGLAIVDMTTLNYYDALALAERAQGAGFTYNDCPVSGMPWRAENGTLTMMFGGSDAAFARFQPLLQPMGEHIIHCGELGMGQVAKAVNNVIYDVNIAAMCEMMPLAIKAGLPTDVLERIITTGTSRSFASEYFTSRILERQFEGDYSLRSAYKDIINVQDLATRLEATTPVVNAMVGTYQQAMAAGQGDKAKSAMVKVYERVLGMEVSRDADS